jgi:hypothetical protein
MVNMFIYQVQEVYRVLPARSFLYDPMDGVGDLGTCFCEGNFVYLQRYTRNIW